MPKSKPSKARIVIGGNFIGSAVSSHVTQTVSMHGQSASAARVARGNHIGKADPSSSIEQKCEVNGRVVHRHQKVTKRKATAEPKPSNTVAAILLLPGRGAEPVDVRIPNPAPVCAAALLLLRDLCTQHKVDESVRKSVQLVMDADGDAEWAAARSTYGYLALVHDNSPESYGMERNPAAEDATGRAPMFGPVILTDNDPDTGDVRDLTTGDFGAPKKRRKVDTKVDTPATPAPSPASSPSATAPTASADEKKDECLRMHVSHRTESAGFDFAIKAVRVRIEPTQNAGLLMAVLADDLTVRGRDESGQVVDETLKKGVQVPIRRLVGDAGQYEYVYRKDVAASKLADPPAGHVRFFATGAFDLMRPQSDDGVDTSPGKRTITQHIFGGDYYDEARCHIALWFALDVPVDRADTLAPLPKSNATATNSTTTAVAKPDEKKEERVNLKVDFLESYMRFGRGGSGDSDGHEYGSRVVSAAVVSRTTDEKGTKRITVRLPEDVKITCNVDFDYEYDEADDDEDEDDECLAYTITETLKAGTLITIIDDAEMETNFFVGIDDEGTVTAADLPRLSKPVELVDPKLSRLLRSVAIAPSQSVAP